MLLDPAASITRAATLLDGAAALAREATDLELPAIFFRGRAVARMEGVYGDAVLQGRRALAELAGVGGPAGEVGRGVDELLTLIDPAVPRERGRGLEWLRQFSLHSDVPTRLSVRADQLRTIAAHAGEDPATTRAALDAEVRNVTSRDVSTIGTADLRRLAVIDGMPADLRPELPARLRSNYGPEELLARNMLPGSDNLARGEFEMYRLRQLREAVVADPTVTREALDAEVRSIVGKRDFEISAQDVQRISVLAGLPDELRPALLDTRVPWADHRLADLSAWGWLPADSGEARAKFAALRMAIEQEPLIADPAVTKETVTRELVDLVSIPDAQLTDEQLHRISVLARLPEHLRPPMPATVDWHYRFEDLGLLRYHPARHRAAASVMSAARVHMAAVVDPERAIAQLAERVRAGGSIDFRVLAALGDQGDLLRANGLTSEVLDRLAVQSLSKAGNPGTKGELRVLLERMRDRFAAIPESDAQLGGVRSATLELLDRNLDRINGVRMDTYARHPDYAEVGRIVASAELLDALRPAARAGTTATAAADAAASASSATVAAPQAAGTISW